MSLTWLRAINFQLAVKLMLALPVAGIAFHLLVLAGIVPYSIVWGGRINSTAQLVMLEAFSIAVMLIVIVVIASKGGYLRTNSLRLNKLASLLLWLLVLLFALNTIGNLFAKTLFEMIVFTPLTLTSSILCARIAIEK
jgi:hypothetical protein